MCAKRDSDFDDFGKLTSGGGVHAERPDLSYAVRTANPEKRKHQVQANFVLSGHLMRRAGLVAGDRLMVGASSDGYGRFRRPRLDEAGYKLSPAETEGATRKELIGKPVACRLSLRYRDAMPNVTQRAACENVVIEDGMILFVFPKA